MRDGVSLDNDDSREGLKRMSTRVNVGTVLALILMVFGATFTTATQGGAGRTAPPRPSGPCDIYAGAGAPCVAAHSTTRALYAAYNGPLYQVLRQSDSKTLDVGVVQPASGTGAAAGWTTPTSRVLLSDWRRT